MQLRLILGEAGSGKSEKMRGEYLEQALRGTQRVILIVPEQITLMEQKKLITSHPGRGLLGADVLSFRRLAHRVLAEQGQRDLVVLDEVGKSMLLYRIAQELEPQLRYYAGSVRSQGFLQRLKALFAELAQYEAPTEALEAAAAQAEPDSILEMKLQDLILLRRRYDEELLRYGEVSEKLLDRLAEAIPQSQFLKGASIYVDDFYGFTPQQLRVLAGLLHCSSRVSVCLTISRGAYEEVLSGRGQAEDLFDESRRTAAALLEMAKNYRIPVQSVFTGYRREDCISHTAREFFRIRPAAWKGEKSSVRLYPAPDRREEVLWMFRSILKLVREQGYSYREIGVVLGDPQQYQGLIRQFGEEFKIPVFMDETRSIIAHPFVRMIRSLLQMVRSRCSYDTLFSFLKTGFTPLSREQLDRLENLALERGWRGFERARTALEECAAGSENEGAVRLYAQKLSAFWESGASRKEPPASWWCAGIAEFLKSTGAEAILKDQARQLRSEGAYVQEAQCLQIFEKVCQVLERIGEMMPETPLSADAFCGILSAGLSEVRLGMLPPALDQVAVGDMDRSRFRDLKALFILGFGENNFPKVTQDQGLLQEKERQQLSEQVKLAPDGLRQLYVQQFRLYMLLGRPSGALYVSYDASPEKGEPKSPSLYWSRFLQILGSSVLVTGGGDELTLAEPCFRWLCGQPQKDKQLAAWFRGHGYGTRLDRIAGAGTFVEETIPAGLAERIWQPESWELSVTRMEQYARCPYAHFLRYGLSLQERKQFQASFADDGRILHGILESASLLLQQFFDRESNPESIEKLIKRLFEDSQAQYEQYQDNSRYRYYWRKLQKTAARALTALKGQVEAGAFRPEYFEWGFGSGRGKSLPPVEIVLSGGRVLRMSGIIDRVDLLRQEDLTYVRIIDYKSGNTEFVESEIEDGVNLQLPVYMKAVTDALSGRGQEVRPAGMFYFHLTPQIQRLDKPPTPEEAADRAKRGARLSGVALGEPAVLSGMARDPQELQNILPVRITKSGKVHGSDASKLRTASELENLSRYTAGRIASLAEEELSGCIRQYPYRKDSFSVCAYCPYREACSFDIRQEGAKERWAVRRRREEFWKQIQEVDSYDEGGRS